MNLNIVGRASGSRSVQEKRGIPKELPPDHRAIALCPEQQPFETVDIGNILFSQAVQLAGGHAGTAAFLHQAIPSRLIPAQPMQEI